MKTVISWNDIYKEWETYASHLGLTSPLNMEDFEGRWSEDFGKGSLFTANLLRTNQFDVEKTAAVWIASFCRDLMQDYAYLLNGKAYLMVNHLYFLAIKQLQDEQIGSVAKFENQTRPL